MKSLLGIYCLVLSASFVTPFPSKAGTSAKDELVLEAGEISLDALLTKASEFLDTNYVISAESRSGLSRKIQCTAKQAYDVKGFRRFFERMLFDCGFVFSPIQGIDGNQFRLVDLNATPQARSLIAQTASFVTPEQLEELDGRAILVTTTFRLRYADAPRLESGIRQCLTDPQLERVSNLGGRSLVVTAYPTTLLTLAKRIKTVDALPTDPMSETAVSPEQSKRIDALEARIKKLEAGGK